MATSYSQVAYRTASASGATHIGILLLVYDALAGDLRKASEAVARGDISERCTHSNHALLLLGHVQEWCASLDDEALERSLTAFYEHLRVSLFQYQRDGTPQGFAGLANLVAETRAAWQKKEQQSGKALDASGRVTSPVTSISHSDGGPESSSWSA